MNLELSEYDLHSFTIALAIKEKYIEEINIVNKVAGVILKTL